MRKTFLFFMIALMTSITLYAQKGEIIYTEYGPEGWSYEFDARDDQLDTLQIDLDNDGTVDLFYHGCSSLALYLHGPTVAMIDLDSKFGYNVSSTFSCFCTYYYNSGELNSPWILYYGTYGDTIPNATVWHKYYGFNNGSLVGEEVMPNARFIGFRFPHENGGYCYGWLEHSVEWIEYPWPGDYYGFYHNTVITLHRWAYCTVPNYPLRIGQTSFDWGVEENDATAFATLHPNPTTGLLSITGKDLRQVEVFNMIGQQVATAQGMGETLHIDISELPAGVYFVRVTDEEGRKCVRKVVKE